MLVDSKHFDFYKKEISTWPITVSLSVLGFSFVVFSITATVFILLKLTEFKKKKLE